MELVVLALISAEAIPPLRVYAPDVSAQIQNYIRKRLHITTALLTAQDWKQHQGMNSLK